MALLSFSVMVEHQVESTDPLLSVEGSSATEGSGAALGIQYCCSSNTQMCSFSHYCIPLKHFDTKLSFVDWHPIRKLEWK